LISFKTDGRFVKLADFGLAKLQESEDQSNTRGVGTNKYMAPEVYTSRKYGTKADVFSLGVIIPELFNFNIDEFVKLLLLSLKFSLKLLLIWFFQKTPFGK
jgi:serine/threonine protein kinase